MRGIKYADEVGAVLAQLQEMPAKVQTVLDGMEPVRKLARDTRPRPFAPHSLLDHDATIRLSKLARNPYRLSEGRKE